MALLAPLRRGFSLPHAARKNPCSFPSAAEKGSPAEAGLEVGGHELAYRSTATTLPSPNRGTNVMFEQMGDLRSGVLIRQHLPNTTC